MARLSGAPGGPVDIPAWPAVSVALDPAGTAVVDVAGTATTVTADGLAAGREAALAEVRRRTAVLARPVRVTATDPTGRWSLVLHPDGRVTAAPPPAQPRRARRR